MNDAERVKERSDIAEIVGGYLQLKQAGRNLKAPCPFHGEKTASFMVSPEKQIFHCFGCNEGGDVITFVMKMDGLDFRGALETLAGRAGIELSAKPADPKAKEEKNRIAEALKLAVKYYQASLIQNKSALNYAQSRGLTRQIIKDFKIGYSPDDWNALSNFLLKKGYKPADLKQAGLVGQKQGRTSIYDLIRGRLMFPICDGQGNPVGFTGRVLDDSLPKYINTPQTPLYDKSRVIFGLHLAKPAIREHGEVVIVEGNMDVVASHQAGVLQVVAVSGTAMTLDQLQSLSRLTKKIKLAFDMDNAGLKAVERGVPLARRLGVSVEIVDMKDAKDPDELIRQGEKLWPDAIASSLEVREYFIKKYSEDFDLSTPLGKETFKNRMIPILRLYYKSKTEVEDESGLMIYIKEVAKRTGLAESNILKSFYAGDEPFKQPKPSIKSTTLPATRNEGSTGSVPETNPARRHLEEAVLAINLAYPEVRLSIDDVTAAHFDSIDRQTILEGLRAVDQSDAAQVAQDLPKLSDYVKILTLRGEETYDSFAPADRSFEAFELARRLQKQANKELKVKLTRKLREAEVTGDADLARMLREEYHALMKEDN